MNLDFGLDPVFSWYIVLLCLSGVVMVVLGAINKNEQSAGSRAFGVLAGIAFLGYGIYLNFIFTGGSYWMFFQAFILPALLVINFIRSVVAKPTPPQPYMGAPAQPVQGAQPQYPAAPGQPQQYPANPAQAQQYPGQPQSGPTS